MTSGSSKLGCCCIAAISLFIYSGCVPVGVMTTPDILAGLSDLILQPQDTCAAMRERFRVEYLPVVEDPGEIGMAYEEHRIPLDSDTSLRLWYLPTNFDRGTVVYSMGTAGPMACYLFSADLLTSNGWSVVMYEYEGYGGSDGHASLNTLTPDLQAAVEWARERTGRDRVTLMGMSLGSIPSVAVAVEHPDMVNGVILDSPVALQAQIERFAFVVAGQTQLLIDRLEPDLLSDAIIGDMTAPLLIFSHELDPVATPESVDVLFERAAGPKLIVRFPAVGHASSQFVLTDMYIYYLETFLTDVWANEELEHLSSELDVSSPPAESPAASPS